MPRTPSETLETILPASKRRETLTIYLADDSVLYLSRGAVTKTIEGSPVTFQNKIREISGLRQSIDSGVDRITITCENISGTLGNNLASNLRLFDFAFAVYGRIYESIRDSEVTETIETVFSGVIADVLPGETHIDFEIIADYESLGAIVGGRTLSPRCPWKYKNGIECTSESSETDCSKTRAACVVRGKEYQFGGTEFFEEPVATVPAGDGSGIGTGTGGGGGGGYDAGLGGGSGGGYDSGPGRLYEPELYY